MKHHILLIDDDLAFRRSMSGFLKDEGFLVTDTDSGDEAIALTRQGVSQFSIALVDYHMPVLSGLETIKSLKLIDPNLIIFAFSGDDSVETYNSALESGAVFFIEKDIPNAKLLGLLHRACSDVEKRTKLVSVGDHTENQKLIEKIGMIGVSDSMAEVAKYILKFAPLTETVLIRGENGTGKEKVARALHVNSARSKQSFIAVNCAAIPENLIESELFGYEKGAFTGAMKNRIGHIEAAQGGTLFLDEIGDFPFHLQAKLLRVLQEKQITPVGSTESKKIDFRLITATNVNLEQAVQDGKFREDLYFRLNVLPINIPPLRDRPEDIAALAVHFLRKENLDTNQDKKLLSSSVDILKNLKWQGNVRELEHAIKHMVTMSSDDHLDVELLLKYKKMNRQKMESPQTLVGFKSHVQVDEKNLVKKALESGGNVSAASRILNVSRPTLRAKMKKYQLFFEKITTGEV